MPINTTRKLIEHLLVYDIGVLGSIHTAAFVLIGELSLLQIAILCLNGILILARLAQIIKNWNKGNKNG